MLIRAFVVLALSFLLMGCSSPAEIARREIARVTSITQVADAGLKSTTKALLEVVVEDERARRASEMKDAGCVEAVPPASMPAKCAAISAEAMSRYMARSRNVSARAQVVDRFIAALYQTLLVAVMTVGEAEAGLGTATSMQAILGRLGPLLNNMLVAYAEWKAFAGQVTK